MTAAPRSLSPEFALLAACALLDDERLARHAGPLVRRPGFDWARVARQAEFHGVEQVAGLRLEQLLPGAVPDVFAAKARQLRVKNAALYAAQARTTVAVIEALAREAIPALALKGAALAAQLYSPVPEARASSDIDILIRTEDLRRGDEVLRRAGMVREWPQDDPPDAARPMFLQLANVFAYRVPVSGELVELHWRATLNPHALPATFDELRAASEPIDTGHGTVATLTGPVQLHYLCRHVLCQLPWRLKWFGDIARALRRAGETDCAGYAAWSSRPVPLGPARLTGQLLGWFGEAIEAAAAPAPRAVPARREVARIARAMEELRDIPAARSFARLPTELGQLLFVLRLSSGWRDRANEVLLALSDPRDAVSLQLGTRFAIVYGLLGPVLSLRRFIRRPPDGSPVE